MKSDAVHGHTFARGQSPLIRSSAASEFMYRARYHRPMLLEAWRRGVTRGRFGGLWELPRFCRHRG